ncbi:MAG: ADP-forming succinate--CoA ligase subunit beta [Candidatus Dasytiphilus stammeri]
MNVHEYQAKQLFLKYGLPIPMGYVCTTYRQAEEALLKMGPGPWVVKCQIHAGGRGKSGGVKLIRQKRELRNFTDYWLGKRLVTAQTSSKGQLVNQLLIETTPNITQELYLGTVIDRSTSSIIFIASIQGGVNIEEVSKTNPHLIHKVTLDLLMGPQPYQGRQLAFKIGLTGKQISQFTKIFMGLARLFIECDLILAEINPLVITENGDLICLDGKLNIDDNALFRQPELRQMNDPSQEDPRESYAAQWELNYVALNGNIGCLVNGAGLAMGTMDIVKLYGGQPANFLDVGGSATKERVTEAFKIILSDNKVKAILVNIFGGIVSCDLIADGIISAVAKIDVRVPVIVRLEGNQSYRGAKKIAFSGSSNLIVATSLKDAAQRVVAATKETMNVNIN